MVGVAELLLAGGGGGGAQSNLSMNQTLEGHQGYPCLCQEAPESL